MDRLRGPHRSGWVVFIVVIALAAAVAGGLGVAILGNRHKTADAQQAADKAQTALRALCYQRHDLDVRIDRTARILIDHPTGKFVFGIPRAALVDSLKTSVQTRANLNILDCKESK